MPLLDYTTSVPVARSISVIQAKLVEHGARAVMMKYGNDGKVVALLFEVERPNGNLPIRLPIDADATLRVLQRQAANREIPGRYASKEHAYRVAWRIIKDWVEAQMSLLETEMVRMEQIFLPYIVERGGRTLYEVMVEKHFLLGTGEGGRGER